jgi:Sec-independent protein translocase protein TatA
MLPIGQQESLVLLTLAVLAIAVLKLPELARGLGDAVPEFSHAAAAAALALDLDGVGRQLGRSLSVLTGTWR